MKLPLKLATTSTLALLLCQGALAKESSPSTLELTGSVEMPSNSCALTYPSGNKLAVGAHKFEDLAADQETSLKKGSLTFSLACAQDTPMALKFSTTDTAQLDNSSLSLAVSADKATPLAYAIVKVSGATTGGTKPVQASYALTGGSSTPFEIDENTPIIAAADGAFVHGYTSGDKPEHTGVTFVDKDKKVLTGKSMTGKLDVEVLATPTKNWDPEDSKNKVELNGQLTVTAIYN